MTTKKNSGKHLTAARPQADEVKVEEKLFWEAVAAMRELAQQSATAEVQSCVAMGEHVQTYAEKTGIPLRTATGLLAAEVGPSTSTIWRYVKVSKTFPLNTLETLLQKQKADAENPISLKLLYECARAGGEDQAMSLELLKTAHEDHLSANDVARLAKGEPDTAEPDELKEDDGEETGATDTGADPLSTFIDVVTQLGAAAAGLETSSATLLPDDLLAASVAAHRAQRAIESLCQRLDAKRMAPASDVTDPTGADPSFAPPTSDGMLLTDGTP